MQGFGISQPQQVSDVLKMGVNGAISGSATVQIIEKYRHDPQACLAELAQFTQKNETSDHIKKYSPIWIQSGYILKLLSQAKFDIPTCS